jgi:hypothetical protein
LPDENNNTTRKEEPKEQGEPLLNQKDTNQSGSDLQGQEQLSSISDPSVKGVCAIQVVSSGNKREGIVYNLVVDGQIVPECTELC